MARLLALDWTQHEARYVLASGRGSTLEIESLGSLTLGTATEETSPAAESPSSMPSLGERLREALAGMRLGRVATLVGVDRSQVEFLELVLPPASDRELPEMVLNQAMRESPAVTEESAIDFVPVPATGDEPRKVRAVSMSPEQLSSIKTTCESAGVVPQRVVFRPFASASLFLRSTPAADMSWLLVNVVDDAADLTLVSEGRIVFTRTLRLPSGDATVMAERLATEIRRTVVLAPADALGGLNVAGIYVFGRADERRELIEAIQRESSLDVQSFDPFLMVGASPDVVPTDSGRFTSLLGMLLDESSGTPHAVDLLHPRRAPKVASRRRSMTMIAAGAALALLLAGGLAWSDLSEIETTNEQLNTQFKELDAEFKRLDKSRQLASAIDEWEQGGVNWLDELKELSVRYPSSRDAIVLRMSMSPSRGGGGVITLQGQAREPAVVERIGNNIRDDHHEIQTPRVQERLQEKSYAWHFETSIYVAGGDPVDDPAKNSAESNQKTAAARGQKDGLTKHEIKQAVSRQPDTATSAARTEAQP